MPDREKAIEGLKQHRIGLFHSCDRCPYLNDIGCQVKLYSDALALLEEQEELIKYEYWRGYNNGRADERGLQEGTIMQTFSPD